MARIYLRLVLTGDRSIESVPTRWRAEVEALMSTDGSI